MRWLAWVVVMVLAGCVENVLVPEPNTPIAAGTEDTAFVESAGVRVWADGSAWRGDPLDLATVLTPVRVTLENRSGRPVRLSYPDITLAGESGFRYPAIAPMAGQMGGVSSSDGPSGARLVLAQHPATPVPRPMPPPPHYRFHHHGFYVAPHYVYRYPGYYAWPYAFSFDPFYYDRYPLPQQLPTQDMLAEALPEGVIEDGGQVRGFVYFSAVQNRERRVRLQLKLVDAGSQAPFGKIEVPFVVATR